MKIAGDLCVFTNHNITIEVLNKANEQNEDGTKPLLAYWNSRGKGAQIHYLLAYLGVDYDSKVYTRGPSPSFAKTEWKEEDKE